MRNFILIGLLVVLFPGGCSQPGTFSSSDLVGTWKFTSQFGDSSSTTLWNGKVSFEASGKSIYEATFTLSAGDKKATCKVRDISTWRIEGNYIVENTMEFELYNYNGDIDLINILKNSADSEFGEDEKSKILELSDTKMIVLLDIDEELIEITLYRIQ
jgi:hypothetical protein